MAVLVMIAGTGWAGRPAGTPWVSANGVVLADLVPAALRRRWVELDYCPGRDLYSLFSEHARAHPDRAAVVEESGEVDYATLDQRVHGIAAALADAGLGPGHIIGIQLPNDWRAVAAELAVAAVGAVALPYPAGRGRRDTLSLLGRARASAAIAAGGTGPISPAATLAGLRRELPDLRVVFTFGAAPAGCRSVDAWLADESVGRLWSPVPVDPEAPARILVSSGSEAEPKMVAYSHNAMAGGRGNYIGSLHDRAAALRTGGAAPPGDANERHDRGARMRNLILVPLASSYGSCGTSATLVRQGGTVALIGDFDPAAALRMIMTARPSLVFGVPTMLRRMAELPPDPGEDLSSLSALVASGAPLPGATVRACQARFGCPVVNVYGSADGVNCHTVVTGTDDADPMAERAGRADPAVAQIRIVDAQGAEVPHGETAEIWARGPMTPLCYVAASELDARYRAAGGWVRTGDRGLIDTDGHLRVVGRIKQVIIRGGYSISPAEVEREISAHPAIAEAVCVALPHGDLGERVCACIAQRPGTLPVTLAGLSAFLEDERGLERRKLPELLLPVTELPLGPTGKVCRQTLGQLAAEWHRTTTS